MALILYYTYFACIGVELYVLQRPIPERSPEVHSVELFKGQGNLIWQTFREHSGHSGNVQVFPIHSRFLYYVPRIFSKPIHMAGIFRRPIYNVLFWSYLGDLPPQEVCRSSSNIKGTLTLQGTKNWYLEKGYNKKFF